MTGRPRTLVVVCHPKPESLMRAALARVLIGLERSGHEVRLIDLDELDFDPRLTIDEVAGHLGQPEDRPTLAEHIEALQWCQRLVLVYPTWFSSQPARLKGWFDRVWMHQVAFVLPEGANRIRGQLHDLRRIDVVTSHGASRLVNAVQGNGGKARVRRTLRVLANRRCRTTWTAIYEVDNRSRPELAAWLDRVEETFAR